MWPPQHQRWSVLEQRDHLTLVFMDLTRSLAVLDPLQDFTPKLRCDPGTMDRQLWRNSFLLQLHRKVRCLDLLIFFVASLFMQHSLGQALEEMDYGLTNMIS